MSVLYLPLDTPQTHHKINYKDTNKECSVLTNFITNQERDRKENQPIINCIGSAKCGLQTPKILLGSYAKLNLGATNTTRERTIGVIVLQKSNGQLKKFYVLSIGRQINEYQLTEIPIYNYAIDCVEEIS